MHSLVLVTFNDDVYNSWLEVCPPGWPVSTIREIRSAICPGNVGPQNFGPSRLSIYFYELND